MFPFNLPPILGLGNTGGFQYILEALQGQPPGEIAEVMRGLLVAANQQPQLAGVFSTFAADTPQVYLDVDRNKAQVLGVKISDLFNALQSTIGRYYVNDFNLFGRIWHVNLQAETRFRGEIDDIFNVYARSSSGRDGADPGSRRARDRAGAASAGALQRLSFGADQRRGAAGRQLRRGLGGDGADVCDHASPGYAFEWTGTALQEKAAAGGTSIVLGFAILFAYLFLVALYESWNIPISVLLSVSVSVLGAIAAHRPGGAASTSIRRSGSSC